MKTFLKFACFGLVFGFSSFGYCEDDEASTGTTFPPTPNGTDTIESTTTADSPVGVPTKETPSNISTVPGIPSFGGVSERPAPAAENVSLTSTTSRPTNPDVTLSGGFRPVTPYWPNMGTYYYYGPPSPSAVCAQQTYHTGGYKLPVPASGAWTGLVSITENPANGLEILKPPPSPAKPTEMTDPLYSYVRFDFTGDGNDASWSVGSHPRARRALFGWRLLSTRKTTHHLAEVGGHSS